jgi:hypothetical protein
VSKKATSSRLESNPGFIALWRKSFDNPLYFSEPFTRWQAWTDLLLLANHKTRIVSFRGIPVKIRRGQAASGENFLAERWKWSRGKVRRFLKLLETEQQIVQQKNNVIGLISILNYDTYQVGGTANGTADGTTNGQQTVQQTDTPNNGNNVNNGITSIVGGGDGRKKPKQYPDYPPPDVPKISEYADIEKIADPIVAAIAVTGETDKKAWGYWVKIRNMQLAEGMPEDQFNRLFIRCVEETYGEARCGELEKPGAQLNNKLKKIFAIEQ